MLSRNLAAIAAVFLACAALSAQQPVPAELRERLQAFEKQQGDAAARTKAIAGIARDVIAGVVATSPSADAVVSACVSEFLPREIDCLPRLRELSRKADATVPQRVAATAALVRLKAPKSDALLLSLTEKASEADAGAIARHVLVLPPEKAVPILTRLLGSSGEQARIDACDALGSIDAFESRQALQKFLEDAPRGTNAWFACTVAAARLGDIVARRTVPPIANYLRGMQLVGAAEVIIQTDAEHGMAILSQVLRECSGVLCQEAADRLVDRQPALAHATAQRGFQSTDPEVRAAALVVLRRLGADLTPALRAALIDPHPLIRVRASELILNWAARRSGPGEY